MGACPRYVAKLKQKEEIKFAFLYRSPLRRRRTFHIAILTVGGKFYEYSLHIYYPRITKDTGIRIKQLFSGFLLTDDSEVMIDEEFGYFEPLYFYFDFVHQHVPFRRRNVNSEQIVKRIATYHNGSVKGKKISQVTIFMLRKLWKWLIDHKKCPWITQEYDYQLQKYGDKGRAKDRMIVRLAMYYAFVSLHFREKNERVDAKKAARLQQQQQLLETQASEEAAEDESLESTLSVDEISTTN